MTARKSVISLVLALSLGFVATKSMAQEYGDSDGSSGGILGTEWTLKVGAGASYSPDYEGSDDYEWNFVPIVQAKWRDLFTVGRVSGGLGVEATPFRYDTFSFGFGVAYWGGRDDSDNAALSGLGDIDPTLMGTATIANRFQFVEARATLLHDFTGNRDGTAVKLGLGAPLPMSDTGVRLIAGVDTTWADENHMSKTFGINAAQAAQSGYATHDADASFKDISASLTASYDITDDVAVVVRGQVKQLLGDAADSPIVDQNGSATQGSIFAGITYQF